MNTESYRPYDFLDDPRHDSLDGHCYEGCSCLESDEQAIDSESAEDSDSGL